MITAGFMVPGEGRRECANCREPIAFGDEVDYDNQGFDIHAVCPRDIEVED